jgi:hypothetical protein
MENKITQKLIRIASVLDASGHYDLADRVTSILIRLAQYNPMTTNPMMHMMNNAAYNPVVNQMYSKALQQGQYGQGLGRNPNMAPYSQANPYASYYKQPNSTMGITADYLAPIRGTKTYKDYMKIISPNQGNNWGNTGPMSAQNMMAAMEQFNKLNQGYLDNSTTGKFPAPTRPKTRNIFPNGINNDTNNSTNNSTNYRQQFTHGIQTTNWTDFKTQLASFPQRMKSWAIQYAGPGGKYGHSGAHAWLMANPAPSFPLPPTTAPLSPNYQQLWNAAVKAYNNERSSNYAELMR